MALIQKTRISKSGITFNRLTHNTPFYAVTYDQEGNIEFSTPEDQPLDPGSKVSTMSEVFGADTYQELVEEIENKVLTWTEPTE